MRVRGFWPLREDRAIDLPIERVDWLVNGDSDGGDHGGNNGDGGRRGHGGNGHNQRPGTHETSGGRRLRSRGPVPDSSLSGKVFIPTNPFTNPVSLQALKQRLRRVQPGKAMQMTMLPSGANSTALTCNYCSTGFLNLVYCITRILIFISALHIVTTIEILVGNFICKLQSINRNFLNVLRVCDNCHRLCLAKFDELHGKLEISIIHILSANQQR